MAYDPTSIPPEFDEDSLLVHTLVGNQLIVDSLSGPLDDEDLVESVGQGLDKSLHCVTATTAHFSCRALLASLFPLPTTLVSSDGTRRLDILSKPKVERPGKGIDGGYGKRSRDDNGDGAVDDCGEFLLGSGSCQQNKCVGGAMTERPVSPTQTARAMMSTSHWRRAMRVACNSSYCILPPVQIQTRASQVS